MRTKSQRLENTGVTKAYRRENMARSRRIACETRLQVAITNLDYD